MKNLIGIDKRKAEKLAGKLNVLLADYEIFLSKLNVKMNEIPVT